LPPTAAQKRILFGGTSRQMTAPESNIIGCASFLGWRKPILTDFAKQNQSKCRSKKDIIRRRKTPITNNYIEWTLFHLIL
jgi:hypothetical protein